MASDMCVAELKEALGRHSNVRASKPSRVDAGVSLAGRGSLPVERSRRRVKKRIHGKQILATRGGGTLGFPCLKRSLRQINASCEKLVFG